MKTQSKAIRWTLAVSEREFGMNRKTMLKRMRQFDINPGPDGKFSTRQICAAVFGDIESERLRFTKETADQVAIKNALARRELIPVTEVADIINRAIPAIKAAIYSSANLERADKDKIVTEVGRLWDESFGPAPDDDSGVAAPAQLSN